MDLWELSEPNIWVPTTWIAFAFVVQAVMVLLNYEVSFITPGIAELSKAMADPIQQR